MGSNFIDKVSYYISRKDFLEAIALLKDAIKQTHDYSYFYNLSLVYLYANNKELSDKYYSIYKSFQDKKSYTLERKNNGKRI